MTNVLYPSFGIKIADANMKPEFVIADTTMAEAPLDWKSQAAEPIKSKRDIELVINYFMNSKSKRGYRNALMFVAGINFGLRVSDLTQLRFGHLIRPDGSIKDEFYIREIKTARKRGKNDATVDENGEVKYKLKNPRRVFVNQSVKEMLRLYCGSLGEIKLDDYLFPGQKPGTKLSYQQIYHIFMTLLDHNPEVGRYGYRPGILVDQLTRPVHASTHMLRKTFAYHFIMNQRDQARAIQYLQICFGHSSQLITLAYAGITDDEIANLQLTMNLGGDVFGLDTEGMMQPVTEQELGNNVVNLEVPKNDPEEKFWESLNRNPMWNAM